MIARGLLRWKLEMHMTFENRLNSRYMNGELPTKETFFDPVLEKYLEKDTPILGKSRICSQRYARVHCSFH